MQRMDVLGLMIEMYQYVVNHSLIVSSEIRILINLFRALHTNG